MTAKYKATAKLEPTGAFCAPTIESTKQLIKELIQQELAEHWTEDKIRERIQKTLDSAFTQIVKTSLGFSKSSWGDNWEVDHCNGRGGNTEITAQISAIAKSELTAAIQRGIDAGKFSLNAKHMAALEREFNDAVIGYDARQQVKELAKNRVDKLLATLEGRLSGADY